MNEGYYIWLVNIGYPLVVLLLLYLVVRATPVAFRYWRDSNYKYAAANLLLIAVALALVWHIVSPFLPMSERTRYRIAARDGLEYACKHAPACMDCDASGACVPCSANSGCTEAVDQYSSSCFEHLSDRWDTASRSDFTAMHLSCIDKTSGHTYFEKVIGDRPRYEQ